MSCIPDESVQLIVTSPPYPMVQMWDDVFCSQEPAIQEFITDGMVERAYNMMHQLLSGVWEECDRITIPGGFICINIGDAVRTINGIFRLYPNHITIADWFISKGYCALPDIIWHKVVNTPTKFMGSGMYPAGAYVTLEHEYILIFRKGGCRQFNKDGKVLRHQSAYFWEERNTWFSYVWTTGGIRQTIPTVGDSRQRSASYHFDIPYRLINMYSVKGDTVVDPFVGLGTTSLASAVSNRNSIGFDIDGIIAGYAMDRIMQDSIGVSEQMTDRRVRRHIEYVSNQAHPAKYLSLEYGFPVKTNQETKIKFEIIDSCEMAHPGDIENSMRMVCTYRDFSMD